MLRAFQMEILNASEGIEVERAESVLGKIPYSLVCLEYRGRVLQT